MDPSIVFEVFRGQTILSLTYSSKKVLEAINAALENKHLDPDTGDNEEEIENSAYRNLRLMLLYKPYLLRDKQESPSSLHAMTCLVRFLDDPVIRDSILKISGVSSRYSIFEELSDTINFAKILKYSTSRSTNEMSRCLADETSEVYELPDYKWPLDLTHVTYTSSSFMVRKEDLDNRMKEEFKEGESSLLRTIHVKVLDIGWMYTEGKNFLQMAHMLDKRPHGVYESTFIKLTFD